MPFCHAGYRRGHCGPRGNYYSWGRPSCFRRPYHSRYGSGGGGCGGMMFPPSPCHVVFKIFFGFLSFCFITSIATSFLTFFLPLVASFVLPSLAFAFLAKNIMPCGGDGSDAYGVLNRSQAHHPTSSAGEEEEEQDLDLQRALLSSLLHKEEDHPPTKSRVAAVAATYAAPQELHREDTETETKLAIDIAGFVWNQDLELRFDESKYLLTIEGKRTNRIGEAIVLHRAVFLTKDVHKKDSIRAVTENGVLTITIAKKPVYVPVAIPIHQNDDALTPPVAAATTTTTPEEEIVFQAQEAELVPTAPPLFSGSSIPQTDESEEGMAEDHSAAWEEVDRNN